MSDDIDEAAIRAQVAAAREVLPNPYLVHRPGRTALEQLVADVEALLEACR